MAVAGAGINLGVGINFLPAVGRTCGGALVRPTATLLRGPCGGATVVPCVGVAWRVEAQPGAGACRCGIFFPTAAGDYRWLVLPPLGVVFCVAPAQGTAPCWSWRFHVRIPEMNALVWARLGMGNEWFPLDRGRCPLFGARACPSSLLECRGRGFFVVGSARGPLHAVFVH